MVGDDVKDIQQLLDDYLRMYSSRDERLTELFSETFTGFTGGGDVLVKDRKEWVAIILQDFARIAAPLFIKIKDQAVQLLSEKVAVATSFFTIHLPNHDRDLSRDTVRLVLVITKELSGWKISHSSISFAYNVAREGEIYPLETLTERNLALEEMIAERTQQLCAANETLQRTNEKLEQEVVQHQQVEEALRESEALYRLLTENASDVVWKVDGDFRFIYVSPADERLRGYRAGEVIGRHVFELFDEEGIATLTAMAGQRLEAERKGIKTGSLSFEARHRCKDGRWLWAEVRSTPERNARGEIIGYYGISREITERKLAETETRRAKSAAEESNKAKSQFLAVMSHEIRTPINALVGFSALARTTDDPVKLRQYLAILEESSRSLMELTNNILDMSKIEAGRMELDLVAFDLRQLLDCLDDQYRPLAEQKRLDFRAEVADRVPVWVLGDPMRLRQILANLLSNAIKFTERGSVACRVSLAADAAGTELPVVRFVVEDTGIGIPTHKLAQLFQPFHQLDPSVTRKFGGTGLGLAIVHSLAELLGGQLAVESREGAGSRFAVDLPLPATEPVIAAADPAVATRSRAVLVVEDNAYNRHLLGDLLTSQGHRVTLAENGGKAFESLARQPFDLILLDVRMPDIDGIEVARRIRHTEREVCATPVPIIAVTADADAATREACLAVGMDDVLAKPIIPERLTRAITALYPNAPSSPQAEALRLNAQTCRDMGDHPERARQFRVMLREDIAAELRSLQEAFARNDRTALGRAAHTLKGLCGHLENREPAEQAAWLQHHAASAGLDGLQHAIEMLRADLTGLQP